MKKICLSLVFLLGFGCSQVPKIDVAKRNQLISKIDIEKITHPVPGDLPVLVSLEDFFEGNHDPGSIAPNLANHPGPQKFYSILRSIREKPGVEDVLVEINEVTVYPDGGYGEGWPYSSAVYIISSANEKDIEEWSKSLQPEPDFIKGFLGVNPEKFPPVKPGYKIIGIWWD